VESAAVEAVVLPQAVIATSMASASRIARDFFIIIPPES
jgi:hypothetical protein